MVFRPAKLTDAAESTLGPSSIAGPTSAGGDARLWIGAGDEVVEGTFSRLSSGPFVYSSELNSEPNSRQIEDHAPTQSNVLDLGRADQVLVAKLSKFSVC